MNDARPTSTQAPPSRPAARLDASMTLLTEVMQRPLDPGYAAAAERRRLHPDDAGRRGRATVTLVLTAIAGALLVAAVLDLRLPSQDNPRDVLTAEINAQTTKVDRLEAEVTALQAEIDATGAAALAGAGTQVATRARLLSMVAGATPVVGEGVRITLDDAPAVGDVAGSDPREQEKADKGRVLDRDLSVVVNGLWSAGAEAISVNGQRLTALSSIREAGPAILVNFRPLTPPYEVRAIGDRQDLQVAFATSPAGRYLTSLQRDYGVRASVTGADDLTLPGASGLRLRHASPPAPAESSTSNQPLLKESP